MTHLSRSGCSVCIGVAQYVSGEREEDDHDQANGGECGQENREGCCGGEGCAADPTGCETVSGGDAQVPRLGGHVEEGSAEEEDREAGRAVAVRVGDDELAADCDGDEPGDDEVGAVSGHPRRPDRVCGLCDVVHDVLRSAEVERPEAGDDREGGGPGDQG
jgi:hypothetical protein